MNRVSKVILFGTLGSFALFVAMNANATEKKPPKPQHPVKTSVDNTNKNYNTNKNANLNVNLSRNTNDNTSSSTSISGVDNTNSNTLNTGTTVNFNRSNGSSSNDSIEGRNTATTNDTTLGGTTINVEGDTTNIDGPKVTVEGDQSPVSNTNNTSFEAAPSSAYAYAAQCGTGAGGSTMSFSASVSGESQHCKHLRMAAFYEGLYREAGSGGDEPMARYWYKAMVNEGEAAQALVNQTIWTGAAKENAADLMLPTILCGGVSIVATPAAGWGCAAFLGVKATVDYQKATDDETSTIDDLMATRDYVYQEPINGDLSEGK